MTYGRPMKSLLFAAALALAAPAVAKPPAGRVEVIQPWSRPAAAGTTGIGYMVLANHSHADAVLEKVESPVAARVEMHSTSMAGGVMSMGKADRVSVPAGGETTFGPAGFHLMFVGLAKALKPGDQLPATLTFAGGAKAQVRFIVSDGMGPPAPARTAR